MMRRAVLLACLLLAPLPQVAAQPVVPGQQDALQWLQRVAVAAKKLSYRGTFVYRNGSQTETSRIVHFASNGNETSKLEVLDGAPREVIRKNDEVTCYLPESRLIIIEQRSARRTFPSLLPASLAGLGEHYTIRKAGTARIAGYDSQIVRLEPRDVWRYGHQFWIDQQSGLLLKADVFDGRGESLESMLFTELRIGAPISPESLKPSFSSREGWKIRQARLNDLRDDAQWVFGNELPGFRRQAAMSRTLAKSDGEGGANVMHWIYSDGLAAVSVFVSPLTEEGSPRDIGLQSIGATSIVRQVVDNHLVIVMGDVPPAAVKRFAEGIGVRAR